MKQNDTNLVDIRLKMALKLFKLSANNTFDANTLSCAAMTFSVEDSMNYIDKVTHESKNINKANEKALHDISP